MPSRDLEARMWAEACEMLERAERLHRQFFRPARRTRRSAWEPPLDIYETERELLFTAALPGVASGDVEVALHDGVLSISGVRRLPPGMRRADVRRLEIPHGWFERRLSLAGGRYELDRYAMHDGCLHLVLRKLGGRDR